MLKKLNPDYIRRMKPAKRILSALAILGFIVFIALQFFQIDPKVKAFNHADEYLNQSNAPDEIKTMVMDACYDCHSKKTNYPWYANVQPIGWYLQDHVEHGKSHLDFTDWGLMDKDEREHALHEIVEVLEEREMPLEEYTWLHKSSRLSEGQIAILIEWFKSENPAH